MKKSSNTVWHQATVIRDRRQQPNAHRSAAICFADLSGSGKSTLSHAEEIQNFTGISSLYEEPEKPELIVDTGSMPLEQCVDQVTSLLRDRGIIYSPQ